jgi:hypothetical protein
MGKLFSEHYHPFIGVGARIYHYRVARNISRFPRGPGSLSTWYPIS